MSLRSISRVTLAILIVATATYIINSSNASAGLKGTRILDQTGCCQRCPACDHVCNLEADLVDEDKTCFDVETKVICVPRVVFPWQTKSCGSCDSCDGAGCKGGKLRSLIHWSKKDCGGCDSCDGVGCDDCGDKGKLRKLIHWPKKDCGGCDSCDGVGCDDCGDKGKLRKLIHWPKKDCGGCDSCDGVGCSDCVHNGARTRKICVLKTKKYTCSKCEYTWTAEEKPCAPPCEDACDSGCCDQASCDATPCISTSWTDSAVDSEDTKVTSRRVIEAARLPATK